MSAADNFAALPPAAARCVAGDPRDSHNPGRQCQVCAGLCIHTAGATRPAGGMAPALHIGQSVRHDDRWDRRHTGVIRTLTIEGDSRTLMATIVLHEPIVIPADEHSRQIEIWTQHVPAHELAPFDEREALIAQLLDVARQADALLTRQKWIAEGDDPEATLLRTARAAIARVVRAKP